jgi:hypothetical protein
MFEDFTGADATSIWAAATSGQTAISVHLLACMLARVWPPGEAVSIWMELVNGQQREIKERYEKGAETFERWLATLPKIDHAALADWDNSARAWIRRADEVKRKQQTQVKLVLSNLDIPVGISEKTLKSVLDSWRTALLGMEALLNQQSQIVRDGSLALALSCWHLYPNLDIPGVNHIDQADTLFSPHVEAVLGLESSPSQTPRGVYWSLSLSKLRFYGAPEETTKTFNFNTSRLTMEQLRFIALGCVLRTWTDDGTSMNKAAQSMSSLYHMVYENTSDAQKIPWLAVLAGAADEFLHAPTENDRNIMVKLMNLGKGHGKNILGDSDAHPSTFFGMAKVVPFLSIHKHDRDRIALLCEIAKRRFPNARPGDVVIAFIDKAPPTHLGSSPIMRNTQGISRMPEVVPENLHKSSLAHSDPDKRRPTEPDFSTATSPLTSSTSLPPVDTTGQELVESSKDSGTHEEGGKDINADTRPRGRTDVRFITAVKDTDGRHHFWMSSSTKNEKLSKDLRQDMAVQQHELPPDLIPFTYTEEDTMIGEGIEEALLALQTTPAFPETTNGVESDLEYELYIANDEAQSSEEGDGDAKDEHEASRTSQKASSQNPQSHRNELQPRRDIAMFVNNHVLKQLRTKQRQPYWIRQRTYTKAISCDDINAALENDILHLGLLRQRIASRILGFYARPRSQDFWRSLMALSMIESVYCRFPGATIDPIVIKQPLCAARWFANQRQVLAAKFTITRPEAFGCIGYLDSGLDAELETYKNVMALSSGDSIFVAAALVADPLHSTQQAVIKRILGNVGRPGLSLLVPPPNPVSMKVDPSTWLLADMEPYSGLLEDRFSDTHLRMSFTDWSVPIHVAGAPTGRPFIEAHIVETLVSVYNRGKWVADIDVLDAVGKGSGSWDHQWFFKSGCNHDSHDEQKGLEMTALATWEGFFGQPLEGPTVALTYKNWEARLAMVALAVRRGDRVLLSDGICWNCYKDLYSLGGPVTMSKAYFVA